MPEIDVGSYYFSKKFVHAKNEVAFTIHDHMSILDRLLVMSPLTTSRSMCNLVLFITFLCNMVI